MGDASGLNSDRPGRAHLGMTLEPLRWLHCSIIGIQAMADTPRKACAHKTYWQDLLAAMIDWHAWTTDLGEAAAVRPSPLPSSGPKHPPPKHRCPPRKRRGGKCFHARKHARAPRLVECLGFRVQGLGFRVQGLGCKVPQGYLAHKNRTI